MNRDDYLGYLLHALDDEANQQVEAALYRSPQARAELNLLREGLRPLGFDRDAFEPPLDLAERTIARVAEQMIAVYGQAPGTDSTPVADLIRDLKQPGSIVPAGLYPLDGSDYEGRSSWSRGNVLALCGLVVVLFTVMVPGIMLLRDRQNTVACQQKLSTLHQSLMTYADTFRGALPRVGEGENGASFATTLQRAGVLPGDFTLVCAGSTPTAPGAPRTIDFAYNFGYRDREGNLVGLRRDEEDGQTPLLADAPSPGASRCLGESVAVNHSGGQNVLFLNGSVRFCSHTMLGADENIYCNQQRQIRAGVNRLDTMLGRGDEVP